MMLLFTIIRRVRLSVRRTSDTTRSPDGVRRCHVESDILVYFSPRVRVNTPLRYSIFFRPRPFGILDPVFSSLSERRGATSRRAEGWREGGTTYHSTTRGRTVISATRCRTTEIRENSFKRTHLISGREYAKQVQGRREMTWFRRETYLPLQSRTHGRRRNQAIIIKRTTGLPRGQAFKQQYARLIRAVFFFNLNTILIDSYRLVVRNFERFVSHWFNALCKNIATSVILL